MREKRGQVDQERSLGSTGKSKPARSEKPREHMAKTAELYRNQKLREGSPAL